MSAKIKNRHRLKNKDIKDLLQTLKEQYKEEFFSVHSQVESGIIEDYEVILVDGDIDFMVHDKRIFFTVKGLLKYKPRELSVVVDMGAIPFVTNGADIMAAGIVYADENIMENDAVWICDETHHKPLAVGIALITGEGMVAGAAGKAVRNIHYVGDRLWSLSTQVA